MILFFDTETTGKADFRASPDAEHQPRMVQIAVLLTSVAGQELGSLSAIIKPEGFEIPSEAAGIHGISTEMANLCGIQEIAATHVFDQFLFRAKTVVAHNFAFDHIVLSRGSKIRAEMLRAKSFCTMLAMVSVCKLQGKYGDYKWPKLQEAYKHAFGMEFEGAHDALSDVRACAKVYFWLRDQQEEKAP